MTEKKTLYSIVVPVYNEEESLKDLFGELLTVMTALAQPYEIIFTDDCSSDKTPQLLSEFQSHLPEVVRIKKLARRSGQSHAMQEGLAQARGEVVVTLDADLQNDPADIPRLFEKMKEGYDCVCGWRKSRQDTLLKAGLSKFGNICQRVFTGLAIHDVSCTLRAYKRKCVPDIPLNWEGAHRFIPLNLSLRGYNIGEIVSNHRVRRYGKSKYTHKRVFRVVSDFFKIILTKGRI